MGEEKALEKERDRERESGRESIKQWTYVVHRTTRGLPGGDGVLLRGRERERERERERDRERESVTRAID
jgi:hypothetical protein